MERDSIKLHKFWRERQFLSRVNISSQLTCCSFVHQKLQRLSGVEEKSKFV